MFPILAIRLKAGGCPESGGGVVLPSKDLDAVNVVVNEADG